MKIRTFTIVLSMTLLFICCSLSAVQGAGFTSLGDCLVINDIGKFSFESQGARIGDGSGVVAMADHFNKDHTDTVCSGEYSNISEIRGLPINEARNKILGVEVQVTKHSGSDSDKWLLHEVEKGFRDADDEEGRLGLHHKGSRLVDINGNKVFRYWSAYRWISNNVVVVVDYGDPRKPEPLEIVQAYLQKLPSTISNTFTLDQAHDIAWIKDEMDRRLWLCDKWFMQLQLKKVGEQQVYQASVKSMNIFLDYREKYYSTLFTNLKGSAAQEKNLLAGYLNANNGTGIRTKLKEYKDWWTANKDKSINF